MSPVLWYVTFPCFSLPRERGCCSLVSNTYFEQYFDELGLKGKVAIISSTAAAVLAFVAYMLFSWAP